mgnify:CR=1 FL=1
MAGRIGGPKTRNNKTWTEARYRSFIKGNLRRTTMRWGPIANVLKGARVDRGIYLCAACGDRVPATIKVGSRRVKNIHVDHINPIVDPNVGFTTWDDLIERMFCEADNLQALCGACHEKKTNEEKAIAKARRERLKEEDIDD